MKKTNKQKLRGHIVRVEEITEYGLKVALDNGVVVQIAFNQDYVFLNFSGTEVPPPKVELCGNTLSIPYVRNDWAKDRAESGRI